MVTRQYQVLFTDGSFCSFHAASWLQFTKAVEAMSWRYPRRSIAMIDSGEITYDQFFALRNEREKAYAKGIE